MKESAALGSTLKHVIVDRDGTLNRELEEGWIRQFEQWEWERGSLEALRVLSERGIRVSVVTNQSGIGRGAVAAAEVAAVHERLTRELRAHGVEPVGIYVCPHAPDDGCECRKPKPELVRRAIRDSGMAAEHTLLVGDDRRDLDAGKAAGVQVALVCTGKGSRFKNSVDRDTLVFENLRAAAEFIVGPSDELESTE
jgi:histidinol-phosphate phosphatase family protein